MWLTNVRYEIYQKETLGENISVYEQLNTPPFIKNV